MQNRREIRETAIQFLYSQDIDKGSSKGCSEGSSDKSDQSQAATSSLSLDSFWELVLEHDITKFTKASIKAILHINQGRQKYFTKLIRHAQDALDIITADTDDKEHRKLARTLNAVLKSENKWQASIDRIQLIYRPQNEEIPIDLSESIQNLYTLNRTLVTQREQWFEMTLDFPRLKGKFELVNKYINNLTTISERIHMIENPTQFKQRTELKHLIDTAEKITTFKVQVNQSIDLVRKHLKKINEQIADTVENYKPERIDPVDRAILQLGVAEILFNPEVPNPVAINEAIEISQSLGSTDSSKFINGILDKIAKSNANAG